MVDGRNLGIWLSSRADCIGIMHDAYEGSKVDSIAYRAKIGQISSDYGVGFRTRHCIPAEYGGMGIVIQRRHFQRFKPALVVMRHVHRGRSYRSITGAVRCGI